MYTYILNHYSVNKSAVVHDKNGLQNIQIKVLL